MDQAQRGDDRTSCRLQHTAVVLDAGSISNAAWVSVTCWYDRGEGGREGTTNTNSRGV
jgi:hypothetical protein